MSDGAVVYKKRISGLFKGRESLSPSETNDVYSEWGSDYEMVSAISY